MNGHNGYPPHQGHPPPQGYPGYPPPQQGYGQQPQQRPQQPKKPSGTIRGLRRDQRPRQVSSELRERYRDASRAMDCGPGDFIGICTYSKIEVQEDGTKKLMLGFGVDTHQGPRSWIWSVNADKVPGLFWEAVEAILPDYDGSVDLVEGMFGGKQVVVVAAYGTGDYSERLEVRRLKPMTMAGSALNAQIASAPPPQQHGQPPQQPPPQQQWSAPQQQGYAQQPPPQNYPPQGQPQAPPPQTGYAPAGTAPPQQGYGQTYGGQQPPPQGDRPPF